MTPPRANEMRVNTHTHTHRKASRKASDAVYEREKRERGDLLLLGFFWLDKLIARFLFLDLVFLAKRSDEWALVALDEYGTTHSAEG